MTDMLDRVVEPTARSDNLVGVTVVVVTWNSGRHIRDFAAHLHAALDGIHDHAIVVVDNDSHDDTVQRVRDDLPTAAVVQLGANRGYAAGVNAGIAAAGAGHHVLALNPDVRLEPACVRRLLAAVAADGIGIAVPRLLELDGSVATSLRREPTLRRSLGELVLGGDRAGRHASWGERVIDPAAYAADTDADWATGAAMLLSRRCLDRIGPWDERFFLYSEETDYALRARDAGLRLRYVADAVAVHEGGDVMTSPRLLSIMFVNKLRLFGRRRGPVAAVALHAILVLTCATRAVAGDRAQLAALRTLLTPRRVMPREIEPPSAVGDGFICFSAQDWWYHNRAHSDPQLMLHVASDRPVLFVNSIGMRMPLPGRSTQPLRRILRKLRSTLKLIRRPVPELPRFHVMTPLLLPAYGNGFLAGANARLVALQVRIAARLVGIRNPDIVVTIPTALPVVERMRRHSLIFNRSDIHSEFPEADGEVIREYERQLLQRSDRVLYVSRALMTADAALAGERGYFLDHGVDLVHFRPARLSVEPADVAGIPHPRVGFFGGFDDYIIDFDLLEKLAVDLPDVSIVLVGGTTCSMERLTRHPNVHWLGFRPYSEIPAYGRSFDVGIMPWLDNQWIRYCNPIKLKEYLALGLPVVSTDFPEVRHYGHLVEVASSSEAFVAAVGNALRDARTGRRARRRAVLTSSWGDRARQLELLADAVGFEKAVG